MQTNSTCRTESRRRRERRTGHLRRLRPARRRREGTGGGRSARVRDGRVAADRVKTRGREGRLLFGEKKMNRYVV
jgi:hypothetical protein